MNYQTAVLSSLDEYLAFANACESKEDLDIEIRGRNEHLLRFPHAVMLQGSFPERDFADRWCWQQFGPCWGECFQSHAEYRVCGLEEKHCHVGTWTSYFFVKTDYDFGFMEWYFSREVDRDRFLAFVPLIDWGENFPK